MITIKLIKKNKAEITDNEIIYYKQYIFVFQIFNIEIFEHDGKLKFKKNWNTFFKFIIQK